MPEIPGDPFSAAGPASYFDLHCFLDRTEHISAHMPVDEATAVCQKRPIYRKSPKAGWFCVILRLMP